MLAYKSHADEITSAILVCLQGKKAKDNILKEIKRTFLFINFWLFCSSYIFNKKSQVFSTPQKTLYFLPLAINWNELDILYVNDLC